MSHEHPGDGVRCDHCDRTPQQVPETPQWLLDSKYGKGFMHVLHEAICYACHNRQQDGIEARNQASRAVRVGKGLIGHVVGLSITDGAMWIDGRRVRDCEPVDDHPTGLVRPGQWTKDRPRPRPRRGRDTRGR